MCRQGVCTGSRSRKNHWLQGKCDHGSVPPPMLGAMAVILKAFESQLEIDAREILSKYSDHAKGSESR